MSGRSTSGKTKMRVITANNPSSRTRAGAFMRKEFTGGSHPISLYRRSDTVGGLLNFRKHPKCETLCRLARKSAIEIGRVQYLTAPCKPWKSVLFSSSMSGLTFYDCGLVLYEKAGMYCEALIACDRVWEFSGGNTEALSIAGCVHAVTGNSAAADAKIRQMLDLKCDRYVPPYNLALVFAGLKQTEVALDHLEQAFEDRDVHMPFLLDHKWDAIRRCPGSRTFCYVWGY